MPSNAVGISIRRLRYQRGWTQETLAAKCEASGCLISRGTLAKIESAIRGVSDVELFAIAAALNVPMASLFPTDFAHQLRKSGWRR